MKTMRTVQLLDVRRRCNDLGPVTGYKELRDRLAGKVPAGCSQQRYTAMVLSYLRGNTTMEDMR